MSPHSVLFSFSSWYTVMKMNYERAERLQASNKKLTLLASGSGSRRTSKTTKELDAKNGSE